MGEFDTKDDRFDRVQLFIVILLLVLLALSSMTILNFGQSDSDVHKDDATPVPLPEPGTLQIPH